MSLLWLFELSFHRTQQSVSVCEVIVVAKSQISVLEISLVFPGCPRRFQEQTHKEYSLVFSRTVLPPLFTQVLHPFSFGHHRHCIFPSVLCWAYAFISTFAGHYGLYHCHRRHYGLSSAVLGPERPAWLDRISPCASPESITNTPKAPRVTKCHHAQLQMTGRSFSVQDLVIEKVNCLCSDVCQAVYNTNSIKLYCQPSSRP